MLQGVLRIILGLVAISFMALVHEAGHFLSAKLLGIKTEVFSIGLGPKLLSFTKGAGCRLSLFPFGGYVRLDDSLFCPYRRFLVCLSGPLLNLLAAFLFSFISALIPVGRLSDPCYVAPESEYPTLFSDSRKSALEKGDLVLSSGARAFRDFQDFRQYLSDNRGKEIPLSVSRDGEIIQITVTSSGDSYGIVKLMRPVVGESFSDDFLPGDVITKVDGRETEWDLDVYSAEGDLVILTLLRDGETLEIETEKESLPFSWQSKVITAPDPGNPAGNALRSIAKSSSDTFVVVLSAIKGRPDALGPVSAAESIGGYSVKAFKSSLSSGIRSAFKLLSLVSVSLAVLNLLPIPPLDGGEAILFLYEGIRGKASRKTMIRALGAVLVLTLFIRFLFLDIMRFLPL